MFKSNIYFLFHRKFIYMNTYNVCGKFCQLGISILLRQMTKYLTVQFLFFKNLQSSLKCLFVGQFIYWKFYEKLKECLRIIFLFNIIGMLILFSTESAVSGMWGFTILIFFVRCHWIKITNIPVEVCFFQFGNSCGNTSFLPSIDKPLTVNNYFENSYFCSFCMPIFILFGVTWF